MVPNFLLCYCNITVAVFVAFAGKEVLVWRVSKREKLDLALDALEHIINEKDHLKRNTVDIKLSKFRSKKSQNSLFCNLFVELCDSTYRLCCCLVYIYLKNHIVQVIVEE